jgi:hypothetical protein
VKRTWVVRPDTGMHLSDGGMVEFVSREASVEAFMDALAIGDRAGGVIEIVFGRVATDVPGEMLTNGIAFRWKDRVDATSSPERPSSVVAPVDPDPTPQELEARLEAADVGEDGGPLDGLDPATLDEVDESSIPEPAR